MHDCLGDHCRYLGIEFLCGFCSRCYIKFVESLKSPSYVPPSAHPFPRLIPVKPRDDSVVQSVPETEPIPADSSNNAERSNVSSKSKTMDEWKRWAMHNSELQTCPTKCWKCSRKIGLVGIKCRCGFIYCGRHRPPQKHQCEWDYREILELPTIMSNRNLSDRLD